MTLYFLNTCPRCSGDLEILYDCRHCLQCGRDYDLDLQPTTYPGIKEFKMEVTSSHIAIGRTARWKIKHFSLIEDINSGRPLKDVAEDNGYKNAEAIKHIRNKMRTLGIYKL